MANRYKPAEYYPMEGVIAPDNARCVFIPHDGVQLRVMVARPSKTDPRGTIIFCPGRTEFIEKYFETCRDFQSRGFTVLIMDHRGQGLSTRELKDPVHGHIKRFGIYTDDLAEIVNRLKVDLPKPHILMGHSMGGAIAMLSVIEKKLRPSALVLSAPMTEIFELATPFTQPLMKAMARTGLAKRPLPFRKDRRGLPVAFRENIFTSDERRYGIWARYFRTIPALRVGSPTFRWLSSAITAMRKITQNLDKITVPTLIVAAGADPIVSPASNEEVAETIGASFTNIEGSLHEILMERDPIRNQFWDAFDTFLAKQAL